VPAPRILVLSHTAQVGGGERALLRLLDALDPDTFTVSAIVFEDGALVGELRSRGIRTEVVPLGVLNGVTRHESTRRALAGGARDAADFIGRLARAAHAVEPDLLVANSLKSAIFTAPAALRIRRRWVWHLHDRLAGDYMPPRAAALLRGLARTLPRHVVVNSRATLDTLGRMPSSRTTVVYPGLEQATFRPFTPPPAGVRELVGALARISETKGQWELVQAVEHLAESHPETRFRIVGAALFQDGDYERRVRDLVHERGLDDRIEFAGWTAEPAEALARFGVFVHVPPVPEPFGQVVVEAMAAGIPVIGADDGGIREILDDGSSRVTVGDGVVRTPLGVLVRPGDPRALARAIEWALDHPDDLTAMTVDAAASARRRFSIAETARLVTSVWRSALPRRAAARSVLR
jgi:glycosyltransferase involved in cell wall biosynthesis